MKKVVVLQWLEVNLYHSEIWILNIYVIFVQVFPSKIVTKFVCFFFFFDINNLGYNKLTQFDFLGITQH
jgi:hypothetical protein